MDDKVKADLIRSLSANMNTRDKNEFEKRVKVADLILKERQIDSNEQIVREQMMQKNA
jgi:hypothetical protein